jgi:hypothetical protein
VRKNTAGNIRDELSSALAHGSVVSFELDLVVSPLYSHSLPLPSAVLKI